MSQFPFSQQPPSQGQPQPYGQPVYPPAVPGYYPQQTPQQPMPFGAQPQAYGYPQQPPAAPQYQGPPPVAGTLDAFNSQPIGGGGPTLSFKDAQIGQSWGGTVARDVTNADVQQDTDFTTKAPKFYRDGRPQLVMIVPVVLNQASERHPDGRASLYIKSGLREAWAAGMSDAGVTGAPKGGDQFQLTLTERRATGQGNPKSVFKVQYHREGAQASAPAPDRAAEAGLHPQRMDETAQASASAPAAPAPGQTGAPNSAPQPQAPVQAPPAADLVAGMSPEQKAFLARLQGGQ